MHGSIASPIQKKSTKQKFVFSKQSPVSLTRYRTAPRGFVGKLFFLRSLLYKRTQLRKPGHLNTTLVPKRTSHTHHPYFTEFARALASNKWWFVGTPPIRFTQIQEFKTYFKYFNHNRLVVKPVIRHNVKTYRKFFKYSTETFYTLFAKTSAISTSAPESDVEEERTLTPHPEYKIKLSKLQHTQRMNRNPYKHSFDTILERPYLFLTKKKLRLAIKSYPKHFLMSVLGSFFETRLGSTSVGASTLPSFQSIRKNDNFLSLRARKLKISQTKRRRGKNRLFLKNHGYSCCREEFLRPQLQAKFWADLLPTRPFRNTKHLRKKPSRKVFLPRRALTYSTLKKMRTSYLAISSHNPSISDKRARFSKRTSSAPSHLKIQRTKSSYYRFVTLNKLPLGAVDSSKPGLKLPTSPNTSLSPAGSLSKRLLRSQIRLIKDVKAGLPSEFGRRHIWHAWQERRKRRVARWRKKTGKPAASRKTAKAVVARNAAKATAARKRRYSKTAALRNIIKIDMPKKLSYLKTTSSARTPTRFFLQGVSLSFVNLTQCLKKPNQDGSCNTLLAKLLLARCSTFSQTMLQYFTRQLKKKSRKRPLQYRTSLRFEYALTLRQSKYRSSKHKQPAGKAPKRSPVRKKLSRLKSVCRQKFHLLKRKRAAFNFRKAYSSSAKAVRNPLSVVITPLQTKVVAVTRGGNKRRANFAKPMKARKRRRTKMRHALLQRTRFLRNFNSTVRLFRQQNRLRRSTSAQAVVSTHSPSDVDLDLLFVRRVSLLQPTLLVLDFLSDPCNSNPINNLREDAWRYTHNKTLKRYQKRLRKARFLKVKAAKKNLQAWKPVRKGSLRNVFTNLSVVTRTVNLLRRKTTQSNSRFRQTPLQSQPFFKKATFFTKTLGKKKHLLSKLITWFTKLCWYNKRSDKPMHLHTAVRSLLSTGIFLHKPLLGALTTVAFRNFFKFKGLSAALLTGVASSMGGFVAGGYECTSRPLFTTRTGCEFTLGVYGFYLLFTPKKSSEKSYLKKYCRNAFQGKFMFPDVRVLKKTIIRRFARFKSPRSVERELRTFKKAPGFRWFQVSTSHQRHARDAAQTAVFDRKILRQDTLPQERLARWRRTRRIRFKPGYSKIWRRARTSFKAMWSLKFRYQHKLTSYIQRLDRGRDYSYRKQITPKTALYTLLVRCHFAVDTFWSLEILSLDLVYLNGFGVTNPKISLIRGDLLQMLVHVKYYIVFRWQNNANLLKKARLQKFAKIKSKPKSTRQGADRNYTYPDWLLPLRFFGSAMPPYLEIDYFTLSLFVVYNPYSVKHLYLYENYFDYPAVLRSYNWKYIN